MDDARKTTMQTQGGEGMSQVQCVKKQSRMKKEWKQPTRNDCQDEIEQLHVYMKGGRGIGSYLEALDGGAAAKIKVRVGRLVKQRQMRRVAHHRVDGLVRARGGTASVRACVRACVHECLRESDGNANA